MRLRSIQEKAEIGKQYVITRRDTVANVAACVVAGAGVGVVLGDVIHYRMRFETGFDAYGVTGGAVAVGAIMLIGLVNAPELNSTETQPIVEHPSSTYEQPLMPNAV